MTENLAEGVPRFGKEHSLGHPRTTIFYIQLDTRAAVLGMEFFVWLIVFRFAERNFRLCVNRNFDTIFDPVLPEPNRIFGLLNLSIIIFFWFYEKMSETIHVLV